MGWATASNVTTTHLDSDSDSPTSARPELKKALDELTNVINGLNTSNGACGLDANGLVANSRLPSTLVTSGSNNLTITPATEIVKINNVVQLEPRTVAQLNALSGKAEGQVAYCSNGNAGSKCLAVYDGSNWKVVALGSTIAAS